MINQVFLNNSELIPILEEIETIKEDSHTKNNTILLSSLISKVEEKASTTAETQEIIARAEAEAEEAIAIARAEAEEAIAIARAEAEEARARARVAVAVAAEAEEAIARAEAEAEEARAEAEAEEAIARAEAKKARAIVRAIARAAAKKARAMARAMARARASAKAEEARNRARARTKAKRAMARAKTKEVKDRVETKEGRARAEIEARAKISARAEEARLRAEEAKFKKIERSSEDSSDICLPKPPLNTPHTKKKGVEKKHHTPDKEDSYKFNSRYIITLYSSPLLFMAIYMTYNYLFSSEQKNLCDYISPANHQDNTLYSVCRIIHEKGLVGVSLNTLKLMRFIHNSHPSRVKLSEFSLETPDHMHLEISDINTATDSQLFLENHFIDFYKLPLQKQATYIEKLDQAIYQLTKDEWNSFKRSLINKSKYRFQIIEILFSYISFLEQFRLQSPIGMDILSEEKGEELQLIKHLILSFHESTLEQCSFDSSCVIKNVLTTPTLTCE
ncbi:hypothetical protein ACH42_02185 [Endozoicomonas sp. (ex Bugula neritina AB1)]|nr:hypothetical protein ACH42_02185 [Endozoicomonas sp. (ex Bugula neritina AB1)]